MDKRFYFRVPSDLDTWIDSAFHDLETVWSNYHFNFPLTDFLFEKETGALVLQIALAGYSPENINLRVDGGDIIVEGIVDGQRDSYTTISKNIKGSNFKTKYPIPTKFDISKIVAFFKNGILELKIPLSEERKSRNIKIEF